MAPRSPKSHDGIKARRATRELGLERAQRAWRLRQQCWTQSEIARELKVSRQSVSSMLRRIEEQVLAELSREVLAVKARQTAQLEQVAQEAFAAWLRSKEDAETLRTRTRSVPSDEQESEVKEMITERTVKNQVGTPAFLAQARAALADIRKIWGLESKSAGAAVAEPVDPEVAEAAISAALAAARKKPLPTS